jgi:hypothetical protein
MGAEAGVPTFELVPKLLVENLDMVAARMGMVLSVDCVRVSWSLNTFRTVSALTTAWY